MIIRNIKAPMTVPATPTEENLFSCWRPAACVLFVMVFLSVLSDSDTCDGFFSPFINSIKTSPMYSEMRSAIFTTILYRMTAGMVSLLVAACGSSNGMSTAATTLNISGFSASGYRLRTRTSSG